MVKNKETIQEHKYYNDLYGMNIVQIIVGDFSTRIAHWKNPSAFHLSLDTTPKCFLIETGKGFESVENAKGYYLKTLKIFLEDTLDLLKDISYLKCNCGRDINYNSELKDIKCECGRKYINNDGVVVEVGEILPHV